MKTVTLLYDLYLIDINKKDLDKNTIRTIIEEVEKSIKEGNVVLLPETAPTEVRIGQVYEYVDQNEGSYYLLVIGANSSTILVTFLTPYVDLAAGLMKSDTVLIGNGYAVFPYETFISPEEFNHMMYVGDLDISEVDNIHSYLENPENYSGQTVAVAVTSEERELQQKFLQTEFERIERFIENHSVGVVQ